MVTRRWITPASSRRLIRRQQGLEDKPTRSAISATDNPASCWIRSRILASTESSTSDNISSYNRHESILFLPRNRSAGACFWQAFPAALYDLAGCVGRPEGKKI